MAETLEQPPVDAVEVDDSPVFLEDSAPETVATPTEGLPVTDIPPVKKGISFDKFKDYDPELNEDNAEERFEKVYKERNDLMKVARGNEYVNSDEHIKSWSEIAREGDEELFLRKNYSKFIDGGYTKEQAADKAQKKLQALKDKGDIETIEDEAVGVRAEINKAIHSRANELIQQQENARETYKGLSNAESKKLTEQAVSSVSQLSEVLGLKIDTNNSNGKKVQNFIASGELDKAMSDPKTRAEIAYILQNKDAITKNILNRNNGAKKLLDKMSGGGNNGKVLPKGGGGNQAPKQNESSLDGLRGSKWK